tara:strand:+ start:259 stop:1233 length:975 start_codon:yes stop_codon:yes gene_type:complete
MKNTIQIIVNKNDINQRIDIFLNKKNKEISRTRIKNLILQKKLKVNNKILIDPSKKILYGEKITLDIPEPKKASLKPYNFKLKIVYEDDYLLVIDKPSGISVHPGPGNYDNTIVNALMNLKNGKLSNIGDELRPGIVHRIDKDTSGLIVVAKDNFTHESLSKQFSSHAIQRIYKTLVWGKLRPQFGKIKTLITRNKKNRQLMEVSFSKGKVAITNYKSLEIFENKNIPTFSYVECKLETGRTHQIRVHMSHKGNNILGDKKYRKKFKKLKNINTEIQQELLNLDRQFLHAEMLGFDHPKTGKVLKFYSELPDELKKLLKKLRNT